MKIKNILLLSLSFTYAAEQPIDNSLAVIAPQTFTPVTKPIPEALTTIAPEADISVEAVVTPSEVSVDFKAYLSKLEKSLKNAYLVHVTNYLIFQQIDNEKKVVIFARGTDNEGKPAPRALVHFSINCISRLEGKHAIIIPFSALNPDILEKLYSFHPEDTTFINDFYVPYGSTIISNTSSAFDNFTKSQYIFKSLGKEKISNLIKRQLGEKNITIPTPLNNSFKTLQVFQISSVGRELLRLSKDNKEIYNIFSFYPSPFNSFVGHPDDNAPFASASLYFNPKILNQSFVCPPLIRDLTILVLLEIWQDISSRHFISQLLNRAKKYNISPLNEYTKILEVINFYKNIKSSEYDEEIMDVNITPSPDLTKICMKGVLSICSRSHEYFKKIVEDGFFMGENHYTLGSQYKKAMTYIHKRIDYQRVKMRLTLRKTLKMNESETDDCLVAHLNGKGHIPMTQTQLEIKRTEYEKEIGDHFALLAFASLSREENIFFNALDKEIF